MKFQCFLLKRCACEKARAWVDDQTAEQAWGQCPHADWMFWLVSEIVRGQELRQDIGRAAVDIARTTIMHTKDQRVHDCIAAVDRWLAGEQVDLQAVEAAARQAVWDANGAAWSARSAWAAARAAWAAVGAACAAQYAILTPPESQYATLTPPGSQHADIVRQHIPWATIQPLLERALQETT